MTHNHQNEPSEGNGCMEGIKNLKEVIDFLKAAEICSSCKSKNVYPVITPNLYLLRISSEYSNPGICVICHRCGEKKFIDMSLVKI